LTPGRGYDAEGFAQRASASGFDVFDARHFTETLSAFLAGSFWKMLAMILGFVTVAVFLFFQDARVAAMAMAPLVFAFAGTMLAHKLFSRPLAIPSLMLIILIFGMGVEYSFSFVRGSERCLHDDLPSHEPVRLSIALAGCATLIGMLAWRERHVVLRGLAGRRLSPWHFLRLGRF
jgi:predicted exporter